MGMGLTRSYETKNQKICIYNTINGQKRVTLTSKKKVVHKKILKNSLRNLRKGYKKFYN